MLHSRIARIALSVVGLALFYVAGLVVREQFGIAVTIQNASGKPMRQIRVKVEPRGRTVNVGDLAANKHTRVFVTPRTESHINLEFMDASGQQHVETGVGYVEEGYCGKGEVTVLPGHIESKETIDVVICWNSWLGFL